MNIKFKGVFYMVDYSRLRTHTLEDLRDQLLNMKESYNWFDPGAENFIDEDVRSFIEGANTEENLEHSRLQQEAINNNIKEIELELEEL